MYILLFVYNVNVQMESFPRESLLLLLFVRKQFKAKTDREKKILGASKSVLLFEVSI